MKKIWCLLGRVGFWLAWPGIWLYLHNSQRSRVLIVDATDRILLVKGWLSTQKWSLPGGGGHGQESPQQIAAREVAEETGLQLKVEQLLQLVRQPIRSKGFIVDTVLYVVKLSSPAQHIRPQRFEIIEVAWIDAKNLSSANAEPDVMLALEAWSRSGGLLQ